MNRRERGGAPATNRSPALTENPAATIKPQDRDQSSAAVRVPARFYGPSARRSLGVLLVTSCPYCPSGGPHLHRGGGGLRRAGCGRGEYVVVPVPVQQRRTRGAA
jgi:hypothetical protein